MKPVLVYLDIPQAWGFASISATDSLFGAAGLGLFFRKKRIGYWRMKSN
jgi:hypothetical protein